MKTMRTAIIGCGRFAKRHAAILSGLNDVRLVGFCDPVIENANAYNQQYACGEAKVYQDCESMFSDLGLDLVYICLPPYAHHDEVELACRYGVHFLIEKPIALSASAALEMCKQVRASGVKSQVGFMYRFGEAAQWLKQYLDRDGAPDRRA
jgi:predicted dehydrogenase